MRQPVMALLLIVASSSATVRAESLYDEQTFRSLASDRKAFRVGDVLTVNVYENSSASTTTDTASQRRNGITAVAASPSHGKQISGNLEVGGEFEGGGSTQRANRLLATITVTVQEVLASGDLKVAGEQMLTVNSEAHKVTVEGRVRQQDISSDNVVLSTRLADAKIHYAGEGDLSERQKRAWWRQLLDFLGF